MAQPWVPGPCHIFFTLIQPVQTTFYLGLTARGADIDIQRRFGDYNIDLGGEVPIDKYYTGSSATVVTELTRWDMGSYQVLASAVDHDPINPGLETQGDIGCLMGFEGRAVQLLLVFPYSLKLAYASQPAGYRFVRAVVERDGLPERGAKPSRLRLNWTCWRALDMTPATANIYGPGVMLLYDSVVAAANSALIT